MNQKKHETSNLVNQKHSNSLKNSKSKKKIIKSFSQIKFVDSETEEAFELFSIASYKKIKFYINGLCLLLVFFRVAFSKMRLEEHIFLYFDLFFMILTLILFIVSIIFRKNLKTLKNLNEFFSLVITIYNIYSCICVNQYYIKEHEGLQIRDVYLLILTNSLNVIFSYDVGILKFFFYFAFNFCALLFIFVIKLDSDGSRFKDVICFLLLYVVFDYLNRENSLIKRENYLMELKTKKDYFYYMDLINNLNGMHFTVKRKKIKKFNKKFEDFVFNGHFIECTEKLTDCEKNKNKNEKKSCVFKCLKNFFSFNFFNKLNNKGKGSNGGLLTAGVIVSNLNDQYAMKNILSGLVNDNEEKVKEKNDKYEEENSNNFNNNMNKLNNEIAKNTNKSNLFDKNKNNKNYKKNKSSNNQENAYLNVLCESKNYSQITDKNIENLISDSKNDSEISNFFTIEINNKIYKINFNAFILNKISDEYSFLQGVNLNEVIEKIEANTIENLTNETFTYLGDFLLVKEKKCFEINFRKNKNKKLIEFFLNDLTKIKEAEGVEHELKSKFFAKIAHEFKTPINSIIGSIKNLSSNFSDEKKIDFTKIKPSLNQIENLSQYVIYLINDLIDHSSINNYDSLDYKEKFNKKVQGLNLIVDEINLKNVLEFCSNITKALLMNKGKEASVKVEVIVDEKLENISIHSDEFRLKQILLNFLSNSVKFTRSGSIKIKADLIKRLNDNNEFLNTNINGIVNDSQLNDPLNNKDYEVLISVIDTGIGMKENELKSLLNFSDFNMLETGKAQNQEGSGLGLSIANQILKQLNHEMLVESKYGKGSSFSVKIKLDLENFKIEKTIEQTKAKANIIIQKNVFKSIRKNLNKKLKPTLRSLSNKQENVLSERNKTLKIYAKLINARIKQEKLIRGKGKYAKNNICTKEDSNPLIFEMSEGVRFSTSNIFSMKNKTNSLHNAGKSLSEKNTIKKIYTDISNSEHSTDKKINFLARNNTKNRSIFNNYKISNFDNNSSNMKNNFNNNFSFTSSNCFINDNQALNNEINKNNNFNINTITYHNQTQNSKSLNTTLKLEENQINSFLQKNIKNRIQELEDESESRKSKTDENSFSSESASEVNCTFIVSAKEEENMKNKKIKKRRNNSKISNPHLDDFKESIILKESFLIPIFTNSEKTKNFYNMRNEFASCQDLPIRLSFAKRDSEEILSDENFIKNKSSEKLEEEQKFILIVDDNTTVREALRNFINKILVKRGKNRSFKVLEGFDGADIIKFIIDDQMNNNKIKCVITDENMEFINGSEAVKILKELENQRKIKPITFASNTAYDNLEIKERMKKAGIDYFIPKICSEKEILCFFDEFKIFDKELN